ncbi:hypothetical protein G7054_g2595 [Neopestalotiopsis clavispora]|nr:hypothetical protein G7054_g2595 [Neopestalotiopsis clavispora]
MTNIHYGVFTDVFRNATSDDANGWRVLVARDPTSTNCAAVALVHSEARDQSSERHIPYLTFFHKVTESLPCKCADINRYLYNGGSSNVSHRSRIKILQAREQALQNADNQAWTAARNLARSEWKKSSVWDHYQSVWYDVLRQLLRPDKWLAIGSPRIRKDTAHWAHDIFTQLVLNISGALTPVPQEQWSSRNFYDGFDDPGIAERAEVYCAPIPKIQVDKSPQRTTLEVQSQLDNKEASTKSIESPSKSRPRAQRWDNNKRMDAYTALNRLSSVACSVHSIVENQRIRRRKSFG